ncbi:NAD+ synthetase [Halomonas sp. ML-15]|uniref:nitrilase-related carbon-nitrogen hydrolase n=1 Tax=Halomonas sp. ML-15 TaxID=2773305 RepID=UPI001746A4A4|nr:nitrilase-related carbon-nitrogen hydrolase [Halomonas sp. ML-15]MBD3896282.1 NAD+ synthetase [Halomonas sp. ML-15]
MPDHDHLHVAAVQLDCELGDIDTNLARHRTLLDAARNDGCELLVFPELSLTGYGLGRRVLEVAMPANDPRLAELAHTCGPMRTLVGFVEEATPGECYNAVAVLQDGAVQAVHRKLNLPSYGGLEEGKWFTAGRQLTQFGVAGGWTASTLICADLWNPALVHAALLSRPEVLCAPINSASGIVSQAFSNEHNWSTNLGFYAMTYGTPVIMANRIGSEGSSMFWGGSRILGPRGETLAAASDGETLLQARLSRHAIAEARFELPTHRDADTPLIRQLLDKELTKKA